MSESNLLTTHSNVVERFWDFEKNEDLYSLREIV